MEGQDPNKFGRELRRLAQRSYPNGELAKIALVQIFIRGLNDSLLEKHVGLQGPTTLQEAVCRACNYEAYNVTDYGSRKPKATNAVKATTITPPPNPIPAPS